MKKVYAVLALPDETREDDMPQGVFIAADEADAALAHGKTLLGWNVVQALHLGAYDAGDCVSATGERLLFSHPKFAGQLVVV